MIALKKLPGIKILIFFSLIIAMAGCKKSEPKEPEPKKPEPQEPKPNEPTTTRSDLTRDSIFLYAKEVYLWNDALPTYQIFNPRKYTNFSDPVLNFEHELYDISQIKINTSTGKPYEYSEDGTAKYSYVDEISKHNPVAVIPAKKSAVDLDGNGYDFGMRLSLEGYSDDFRVVVQAVYPGSDAKQKGIERGDWFTVINGVTYGTVYNDAIGRALNDALFESSSLTLQLNKKSGSTQNITLARKSYSSSPVYKDSVYTFNSKKIGYMAYARFSNSTNSYAEFNRIFSRFSNAAVTDLIIDLRYNGGGYVSTAEYLINSIAPTSLNGSVMFVEHYNSMMQQKKATILAKQPILDGSDQLQYQNGRIVTYADVDFSTARQTTRFSKVGSLNGVNSIVFIVSENTASAAELVINSLKPYISNIKLVGTRTYGKPVGFFPIRIDKYDVYFSMFQTKNSAGQGDYFDGFVPDKMVGDDLTRDFGDLQEKCLKAAYAYLTTGAFPTVTSSVKTAGPKTLSEQGVIFVVREFKGMIENRSKF